MLNLLAVISMGDTSRHIYIHRKEWQFRVQLAYKWSLFSIRTWHCAFRNFKTYTEILGCCAFMVHLLTHQDYCKQCNLLLFFFTKISKCTARFHPQKYPTQPKLQTVGLFLFPYMRTHPNFIFSSWKSHWSRHSNCWKCSALLQSPFAHDASSISNVSWSIIIRIWRWSPSLQQSELTKNGMKILSWWMTAGG